MPTTARVSALLVLGLLSGCSLLLGFPDEERPYPPDASASADSDRESPIVFDGGPLLLPTDGAIEMNPMTACFPISTFVPTGSGTGTVCNRGALVPSDAGDAGATGLDFGGAVQSFGAFDNVVVSSCIGVAFNKELTDFAVRVGNVAQACDVPCAADGCGTGTTAVVFAGTDDIIGDGKTYKWIANLSIGRTPATFQIVVPAGLTANQVLVCRGIAGSARDDVAVSAISGNCR